MSTIKISFLRSFIKTAHINQRRNFSGLPYSTHLLAVERIAVKASSKETEYLIRAVALFHDYLEDKYYTDGSISTMRLILSRAGYIQSDIDLIFEAVLLLTKIEEKFDLIKYLDAIAKNNLAIIVKLADLQHNMSDLKKVDLKKYNNYVLIKHYLLTTY